MDDGTYLLQDCGQDKAVVYQRRIGTVLNGIVDVLDFLVSENSVSSVPLNGLDEDNSRLILAESVSVT